MNNEFLKSNKKVEIKICTTRDIYYFRKIIFIEIQQSEIYFIPYFQNISSLYYSVISLLKTGLQVRRQ